MIIEDSFTEEKLDCATTATSRAVGTTTESTTSTETIEAVTAAENATSSTPTDPYRQFPFKKPSYEHKNIVNGKRKPWKTLKQILAQVRISLLWDVGLILML